MILGPNLLFWQEEYGSENVASTKRREWKSRATLQGGEALKPMKILSLLSSFPVLELAKLAELAGGS
jgi:hypothetical protein